MPTDAPALVDRLFRAEASRLVALLTRRLGSARLSLAEDVVQEALVTALQQWPFTGVPQRPGLWLRRVAINRAVDALRRERSFDRRAERLARALEADLRGQPVRATLHSAFGDDELRLVLLCCHPSLSRPARVALSLKIACGLGIGEIARALLADERAIAQRLVRAKRVLRALDVPFTPPTSRDVSSRVDSALDVIYLLFNEAYVAHDGDSLTRDDLGLEAFRLARLVADGTRVSGPRAHALVALIAFHTARRPARVNTAGELVRLEDQDRSTWDASLVALAFRYLERSLSGQAETSFHVQAAIAAAHASAMSVASTDWRHIVSLYDRLVELEPTPVVRLNRAIAVAWSEGPAAGLEALASLRRYTALHGYYLFPAAQADVLARLGRRADARRAYAAALRCRCSAPERRLLESRVRHLSRRSQ